MSTQDDTKSIIAGAITKSTIVVGVFSVLSRLLGLVRDRLLASNFGAGQVLDAYYAAFKIPDFFFNLLVLGAISAAFIPVYIKIKQKDVTQALNLSSALINALSLLLLIIGVVCFIAAPQLVSILTPGFNNETMALTITFTRIMLLAMVIFGVSNVLGSLLQAERKFVSFAAAALGYNLGIILGIILIVPLYGPIGLPIGVVFGSLLHLLIQIPEVRKIGFKFKIILWQSWLDLKNVSRLIMGRTVGLAASSLEQVITAGFISTMSVGSLAAYNLALNLQSFPINVFGVSLAVAIFPVISEAAALNNHEECATHFKQGIRRILFFVLPLAILFLVLRAQIVRVVLGAGMFDWDDTIRTANILGFLALAMISDSLLPLTARTFYAFHDTKTPAATAVISVIVNVILLISLRSFGLTGVGIAYLISRLVNIGLLFSYLGKRLNSLGLDYIMAGVKVFVPIALVSGAATYGMLHVLAPLVDMKTFWGIFVQGGVAGLVGVASYLILTTWAKLPEVDFMKKWVGVVVKKSKSVE